MSFQDEMAKAKTRLPSLPEGQRWELKTTGPLDSLQRAYQGYQDNGYKVALIEVGQAGFLYLAVIEDEN